MDILTQILAWFRVEGSVYAKGVLTAPWGVKVPPYHQFSFHVLERGNAVVQVEGEEPFCMAPGDFVMLSGQKGHTIKDSLETAPMLVDDFLEKRRCLDGSSDLRHCTCPHVETSGDGLQSVLYCGSFRFEGGEAHPLLTLLPDVIHLPHGNPSTPWLESTLRFLACESSYPQQGSGIAVSRLVDLMFIQVIRGWMAQEPTKATGWLGGLSDPQIGKAITLIHQRHQEDWTVDSLGTAVGMSRSNFSSRFQALVGTPPLKYLTQWRMHVAAQLLTTDTNLSLGEIAQEVGYDSTVSFSRAFKRHHKLSPGNYRNTYHHQPNQ